MRTLLLAAGLAVLTAAGEPASAAAQMAVIVHPSSTTRAVSLEDLRRLFLGKTQTIDTTHVQVVEAAKLRKPFYRALLALSDDEVRRRWVALVFRGEATALPRTLPDDAAVKAYVAEHPGAVGFIDASAVDGTVRVLTVDGHKPSEAAYALR